MAEVPIRNNLTLELHGGSDLGYLGGAIVDAIATKVATSSALT